MGTLSVGDAMTAMQNAVRAGAMMEAREIGNRCTVPLAVAASELQLGEKLAEGAESVVYHGRFQGQDVAVKKARIGTSADLERFRSELQLLASFDHPNVVRLLAARALPPDYMLVMPLMAANARHQLYEVRWSADWPHILALAVGLASGMAYVHSQGVLHRDLKPANLLVGADGAGVVITDFGISAAVEALRAHDVESLRANGKPTNGFQKKNMIGTLQYMAPEVLLKQPHTKAADVYAFAVTVNELATGIFPFSDCTKDNPEVHTVLEMGYGRQELAAAVAAEGLRPLLPKHCPPGFAPLLEACWARDPCKRPTFEQVLERLAQVTAGVQDWQKQLERQPQQQMEAIPAGPMDYANAPVILDEDDENDPSFSSNGNGHAMDDSHVQSKGQSVGRANDHVNGGPNGHGTSHTNGTAAVGVHAWLADDASAYRPVVTSGVYETIGPRDSMEDRHVIQMQLCGHDDVHLLAVFDGHRGEEAAEYARQHLAEVVLGQLKVARTPTAALKRAFQQLEAGYREQWEAARQARFALGQTAESFPGCTAVAALIVGSMLYVANAGDSRAVLCRGHDALALSRDHTAALPDERSRIEAAGGVVSFQHNGWRVGKAGLQVSRCLGDFDVKGCGVIAEPEVIATRLSDADYFLVLASDGLWDVLRNDEAVGLVFDTVKEPDMCGKRLAAEALTRASNDNITVLVTFLRPVTTLEHIFSSGVQVRDATPTLYGSRTKAAPTPSYGRSAAADEVMDTY